MTFGGSKEVKELVKTAFPFAWVKGDPMLARPLLLLVERAETLRAPESEVDLNMPSVPESACTFVFLSECRAEPKRDLIHRGGSVLPVVGEVEVEPCKCLPRKLRDQLAG